MAFTARLPATNKFNGDATSMLIWTDGTGTLQYRVLTDGEPLTPLESTHYQQGLNMLLKWMQLGSGNGDFGPLVNIVCCPGMPEGAFHHETIVGLTNSTDSTQVGHLYFSSTRCLKGTVEPGPQNGWNHWFEHVAIPTTSKFANIHDMRDDTGERLDISLSLDHEIVVLKEVMAPNLVPLFRENKIRVLASVPSGTSDHNACDNTTQFRDLKTGIAKIIK